MSVFSITGRKNKNKALGRSKPMEFTKLNCGTHVLSEDVINPTPDRRQKYDWRREIIWDKGTEFLVEFESFELALPDNLTPEERTRIEASLASQPPWPKIRPVLSRYTSQVLTPSNSAYEALASKLVSTGESDDGFLARLDCRDHFARYMLKSGKLDRKTFEIYWNDYYLGGKS